MQPTTDDLSTLDKLYHSGAWLCLGILVAFIALRAAATRWAWLKEDHRTVWVSAILGGLALLVVPASQGTTPNLAMLVAAIGTVLSLHADPKKTPAEQDKAAAQGGFVRLGLMLAIAALGAGMLLAGCTSTSRERHLGYTLSGLVAAQSALDVYVGPHELAIVRECRPDDKAGCEQSVAAFEARLKKARGDLNAALELVKAGYKLNDDKSVANAEAAALAVYTLLQQMGVL